VGSGESGEEGIIVKEENRRRGWGITGQLAMQAISTGVNLRDCSSSLWKGASLEILLNHLSADP